MGYLFNLVLSLAVFVLIAGSQTPTEAAYLPELEPPTSLMSFHSPLTPYQIKKLVVRGHEVLSALKKGAPVESSTVPTVFEAETLDALNGWGRYMVLPSAVTGASGRTTADIQRHSKLEDLIAVIWAFYTQAHIQQMPIAYGTFLIRSHDLSKVDALWQFFLEYAKLANLMEEKDPDIAFSSLPGAWRSNFAYSRTGTSILGLPLSSHYLGSQQMGIDMRFDSTRLTLGVLPLSMRHLIAGLITYADGSRAVFLKPESNGLGDWSSYFMHGLDFLHPSSAHTEKSLNDDLLVRLEPALTAGQANNTIWKQFLIKTAVKAPLKNLQHILALLKIMTESEDAQCQHEAQNAYVLLSEAIPVKEIHVRTGREVHIHLDELDI